MDKPITKTFTLTVDQAMVYTRVVNSILAELSDSYEHFEDVWELKEICEQLDRQIRKGVI